ncbi:MAG: diguanylate cyclase [Chloroflexi bacterium]|nr:diguanylate cyclase [Chloroflexota bacterium]
MANFIDRLLPRSYHTEEETQLARITLAFVIAVTVVFCLVIVSAWSLNNSARLDTLIAGFLYLALPLWFIYRGRLRLAQFLIASGMLVFITLAAFYDQGIHSLAIIAFSVLTFFLGFVMRRHELVFFVLLSILSIAWLCFASGLGEQPQPFIHSAPHDFVVVTAGVLLSALTAFLFSENLRANLHKARKEIVERERVERALRDSEKMYHLLADNIYDVLWILDWETRRYRYISPSVEHLRGYTAEQVLVEDWAASVTPKTLAILNQVIPARLKAFRQGEDLICQCDEIEQPCKDGTIVVTEVTARFVVNPDNGHIELFGVSRDLTERHKLENQLRQLSRAVEASPSSIIIADVSGNIDYVNPKFVQVTGYTLDEVRGKNPRLLQSGRTPKETYTTLWNTILAGQEWHGELLNRKKNGELYWESASISPITDASGTITHFVGIKEDITARKQAEKQLYHLSTHDALTGLYNRTYFESEIARLEHGRVYPITILVADVDHMKLINDSLGHSVGDEMLRAVAEILRKTFRTSDIVARIGGDEFAILLPKTDSATAEQIILRVKENLAESRIPQTDLALGLSIGTASVSSGTLREAYKLADARMYADKREHKEKEKDLPSDPCPWD